MPSGWKKAKWTGSNEAPYSDWECWEKKFPGMGKVTIFPGQWPASGLSFVVAGEYSGFLEGFPGYAEAAAELDHWFTGAAGTTRQGELRLWTALQSFLDKHGMDQE